MIIIMYWSLSVINTVFQTWWSMIIYIHLLCFFESMNWEEAVRGGGPFLKFWWGESTLESNTSHGDVYIGSFSDTCGPYPAISSYTWDPRWDHPMKIRSIRLWIFSQGPGEDFKLFSGQPDKLNTWVLALCGGHLCWIYQGFWLFLRVWEMLEFVKGWDEENIQA